ncbi:protein snakeskin-like [Macrobrachium nipponense]|uniref:protein snakeskin-like n=1 Tax=Macrobrachium nipponense TaxID=159736 RepID=UPI0030C87C9B
MCAPQLLKRLSGALKITELVCVIIAISIFKGANVEFDSQNPEPNTLATGVLIGAFFITPILLICYLVGQRQYLQQTFLEIMINFLFFAGMLTIGVIGINSWQGHTGTVHIRDKALAMSSFCILGCFAYFADFVVATIVYNE